MSKIADQAIRTMVETINVLRAHDGPLSNSELDIKIAENLNLPEVAEKIRSDKSYRSGFTSSCSSARTFLRSFDLIEISNGKRGIWVLTQMGKIGTYTANDMKEIRQKYYSRLSHNIADKTIRDQFIQKFERENAPSVFISYSHNDGESHKEWVKNLADLLDFDGFDVKFDDYVNTGEFMDKFMERSMIDCDKIIAVCSDTYVERANDYRGGVGFEMQILTRRVMNEINIEETKILPIIRNNSRIEKTPNCFGTRKYINFENDEYFIHNYEILKNDLCDVPRSPSRKSRHNETKNHESALRIIDSANAIFSKNETSNCSEGSTRYHKLPDTFEELQFSAQGVQGLLLLERTHENNEKIRNAEILVQQGYLEKSLSSDRVFDLSEKGRKYLKDRFN